MDKLEHKQMMISKYINLCSNDLIGFLDIVRRADGVLPKSTIQKMVEYCNERKNVIIELNNKLVELERGEQIEPKH